MSLPVNARGDESTSLPPLIGTSSAMALARSRLDRFARSSLPVLLVGPTGTGKDLFARHLHALSQRSGKFVDVDCGALPREMIESLLFGHRRGAFTGAIESTTGLIVRADGGTLFLDELSSLPLDGQAKLLRVLETGEVLPLGAPSKDRSHFRLIAAVQEDIDRRIAAGQFRRDLYHRVAGIRIELPPLSQRPEDVRELAELFAGARDHSLSFEAIEVLQRQAWQGNIRELRAVVELATVLAEEPIINAEVVSQALGAQASPVPGDLPAARGRTSTPVRAELLPVCEAHGGDAAAIARALGVSRATLFRWLRSCEISLTALRVSRCLRRSRDSLRPM